MEKFAQRFCLQNPGMYRSPDTAYVLSFSTIMLNTDAHNPGVKHKMTKEGFVKNNRGIDDGGDVAAEHLEALYDRYGTFPLTTHHLPARPDYPDCLPRPHYRD